MLFEEALDLPNNAPILLADGKFGLVIRWVPDEIGVQVLGERDIRWIDISRVMNLSDGALMERAIETTIEDELSAETYHERRLNA